MNDIHKIPDPGAGNGQGRPPERPPTVDLLIRFDPVTQNVELVAPVDERVLLYGMLEMARTMIDDMYLKADLAKAQSRVIPATGPLPPFPRTS